VAHVKRRATRPTAKSTRPSVARLDALDALRRLPDVNRVARRDAPTQCDDPGHQMIAYGRNVL